MNISRRAIISVLVAAITLFTGMLFWPFILNNIIKPIALVAWILLRILVLSMDQKYLWGAIIFAVTVFLLRLLSLEQVPVQSDPYIEVNAAIRVIRYWRTLFTFNGRDVREEKNLKRELAHLLTSLYASKQHASTQYVVYDDLRKGEIPLPEHIRTFLFSEESQESGRPIRRFLRSIQKTPRKWIRQWTGQEKAEHYQMIDEVLCFMEATLEIKNDK